MHKRRIAAPAALALSVASLTPAVAHAEEPPGIYVAPGPGCSDSGHGDYFQPFCTIAGAAAKVTTPGAVVEIAPGTYAGPVKIAASGATGDPIIFRAESWTSSPSIGGPVYIQTDSADAYGLELDGASNVDFLGVNLEGPTSTGHGVVLENSSNDTLVDVVTDQNIVESGNSAHNMLADVEVRNGIDQPAGFTGSGIDIDASGTGNSVANTFVAMGESGSAGITVDGSPKAEIVGDTVTGYCGSGISVGDDANGVASGASIQNNVVESAVTSANDAGHCAAASSAGISVESAADESGLTENYNDVYPKDTVSTEPYDYAGTAYQTPAALESATGQGANDSVADPQVSVDYGTVESESSPVINSANSSAPGEWGNDILGNPRTFADPNVPETGAGTPGFDRGAFQYSESITLGALPLLASAPVGSAVTIGVPTISDNWAHSTYSYHYNFGDNSNHLKVSSPYGVTHTFTKPGTYTITLVVSSMTGASQTVTKSIKILAPVTLGATLSTKAYYGLSVVPTVTVSDDWPITSQTINYGDGNTSPYTASAHHQYAQPGTYTVTYTMTDAIGETKTVTSKVTTQGSEYTPMNPTRLLDTRKGQGGTSGQLLNNGSIKLKVAGVDGIPSNVTAVALNLTAVNADGGGYIEANTGTSNGTSTFNYGPNLIYSNSVIAQVASDGTVTLSNFATAKTVKTDLIADITGYFSTNDADRFVYADQERILDTRSGVGGAKGLLAPGGTDVLKVAGVDGIPTTGVAAVAVNLTVTDTTKQGYIVAYADGTSVPGTSDEDWQNGNTTKAVTEIVPVGTDGKIDITNAKGDLGSADVLVDVTGYFTAKPGSSVESHVYVPVAADRVLDTRKSEPLAAGGTLQLNLAGVDGTPVPGATTWAPVIGGYVFNATATQTQQPGLLLLSNGVDGGGTSTVNWTGAGRTAANLSITNALEPRSGSGPSLVDVHNGSLTRPVQAIADLYGYFIAD